VFFATTIIVAGKNMFFPTKKLLLHIVAIRAIAKSFGR
jgi:hypothetical protein